MSRVLRHASPPGMDAAGWVPLPTLLRHLRGKPSEEDVRQVVSSNDKARFVLDDTAAPPRIRAAQGHSVSLEAPVLEPVTDAAAVPLAVHITSAEGWEAIQASGELRRMARTHVHFAAQPGHVRTNAWASVLLRLDLGAALAAGHAFGLSTNGVLLTEGPLPASFVTRVLEGELPEDWAREARLASKKPGRAGGGGAEGGSDGAGVGEASAGGGTAAAGDGVGGAAAAGESGGVAGQAVEAGTNTGAGAEAGGQGGGAAAVAGTAAAADTAHEPTAD
ncbi:hypothetical protein FOA52_009560 [Chlamydomonas sp. UWO 241]|nr:hypothetical protein FOA52_009560 [Chlamydomonas sp. UWO 241]